jgi:hypothetical protein
MNKVNLLWTGGWDSTFRLVSLISKGVLVQPYYIVDPDRRSLNIEKRTMTAIYDECRPLSGYIYPTISVHRDDLRPDDEIDGQYRQLSQMCHIGKQYPWFAKLAKTLKIPHLETGCDTVEVNPETRSHWVWHLQEHLEIKQNGHGRTNVLRGDAPEELRFLGWMEYPIIHLRKRDTLKISTMCGYMHVMEKTWFCLCPILGMACGICSPCRVVMERGMADRMGLLGWMRYLGLKASKIVRCRINHSTKTYDGVDAPPDCSR